MIKLKIKCGWNYSSAIDENSHIYMWGNNNNGQLALQINPSSQSNANHSIHPSDVDFTSIPTQICIDKSIVEITCGNDHSICITASGEVYSWGLGTNGQLGHGDKLSQKIPKLISYFSNNKKTAKSISAGKNNSFVLTDDGEVYSFGFGENGELGHGDLRSYSTPMLILTLRDEIIIDLSSGASHSLILTQNFGTFSFSK